MGKLRKFGPVSPKFYGAGFGALGGINIGAIIVGLIQVYITHKALSLPMATLIESVVTPLVSALGAWLLPLLPGLKVADVLGSVGPETPAKAA